MAEPMYITPEVGVLELAQAHAAAIFLTDATPDDDDAQGVFSAGASLCEEALARPIRNRHDAAGKMILLRTLLVVAMGGAAFVGAHDLKLIDDVTAYLQADA